MNKFMTIGECNDLMQAYRDTVVLQCSAQNTAFRWFWGNVRLNHIRDRHPREPIQPTVVQLRWHLQHVVIIPLIGQLLSCHQKRLKNPKLCRVDVSMAQLVGSRAHQPTMSHY